MAWIYLSIIAALFYALRFIIVKKYLKNTDTMLIAFASRLAGVVFLLPLLLFFPVLSLNSAKLWETIIITGVLTAIASIMQLHAIKKYEISASVPFLSFTPLFMVISVLIIFNETPNWKAGLGALTICVGAAYLNKKPKERLSQFHKHILHNRGAILFLGVAVIYGLTTTLDRIAIESSSAFTYALLWNIFSTAIFFPIFFNRKKNKVRWSTLIKKGPIFLTQGLLGVVGFLAQMFAVQYAKRITANVIYVKALTMLQLLLAVIFGLIIFKEKNGTRKLIGSILMLAGATIIIIYYK